MASDFSEVQDSGERQSFDTGAVRDIRQGKGRFDLLLSLPHILTRLARHFENGAKKYGDNNWRKGIPLSRYLDSAQRHLVEFAAGMGGEDHLCAAIWNLMCLGETQHLVDSGARPNSLDDLTAWKKPGDCDPEGNVFVRTVHATLKGLETVVVDMSEPKKKRAFTVYLCGPITGKPVDQLWRDQATACLAHHGIATLNPLRGKDIGLVGNLGLTYSGKLVDKTWAQRDAGDLAAADLIFAYFPYIPERQSVGSLMEMGAAAIGLHKPVVVCTKDEVFSGHLFVREFTTYVEHFALALARIVKIAFPNRPE